MTQPLRIGIAGLGTVGQGVVEIITHNAELLSMRTGRSFEIAAVNAHSKTKERDVDISGFDWEDDPVALAKRNDIDVFVELIGGENGVAKAAVEAAIDSGKDVVTANKALLAHHGQALAKRAEEKSVSLRYEAAVAGGIPAIKSLLEGFAANKITRVRGILNGTCNYMLTRMDKEGINYQDVFDDANRLGYLEADPSLDVGGIDAAHKLAILAAIGFGAEVEFSNVKIRGIDDVSLADIQQAANLGFKIRLICSASLINGALEQRVEPCLVPADSTFGRTETVTNMVVVEGDAIGQCVLSGPGAGRGATASAVMGDIVDLARNHREPVFGIPVDAQVKLAAANSTADAPYYLRVSLADKAGVLARVATVLGNHNISIDQLRQYDHDGDDVPVTIVTHRCQATDLSDALSEIQSLADVTAAPVAFRIEMD